MGAFSVKDIVRPTVFGKRREPHTVIIACGENIRHFQVRPWVVTLAGSALAAMAIGYLLATSYLVLRDDLIDAMTARQARMQQAYEDRISALRAQVDRITSRQMLDQQIMETKVGELLERQGKLTQRHGRIDSLLDGTDNEIAGTPTDTPESAEKPDLRAGLDFNLSASGPSVSVASAASSPFSIWPTRGTTEPGESTADRADRLFVAINQSLHSIEAEQMDRINAIAENAYQTVDAISDALETAGLKLDAGGGKTDMGGPLVPVDSPALFDTKVKELDEALDMLERVKAEARNLPIANPSPGVPVSSSFGVRADPILGMPAIHSGMDFRAPSGSKAYVTAEGTVVKAGWNGGYGRMVEVRHENGFTTRYAHLSRIEVTEGQKLQRGDVVGNVGSSGRSTGPHLHYEVRRNGTAMNPLRFLKIGKKVGQYL